MNLYAIDEKETLAALQVHHSAREYHGQTVEDMFERVTQHPAAKIASAVDECRAEPCPYCCADPWEGCRPDCSSYFEDES